MQRTRAMATLGGAGLLLTLAMAGCDPSPDRAGGTVIMGMRTDFGGLNPITNSSLTTDHVMKFGLFTPLIQYDEDLNPTPHLAESWEMHGDTAITFTLRDDVFWHDGQPVTAEDVKFTFDMAKDPETASLLASAYLAPVESAEVLDPRTIRFRFEYPHAQAIEDFWWPPVPRHLLEGVSATEMANASFNRNPVGSGPYRFREWRANERVVLERNEDYPEGLGGPPDAERVVFRIIPEPATRLTELLTGGIHIQLNVEPDQVQRVEETDNVELHSAPGTTLFYIGWNNARPPFNDANVRRAMTLAIDRQEIMDALMRGHARPATSTVPPWHPLYPGADPLPMTRTPRPGCWTRPAGASVGRRSSQRAGPAAAVPAPDQRAGAQPRHRGGGAEPATTYRGERPDRDPGVPDHARPAPEPGVRRGAEQLGAGQLPDGVGATVALPLGAGGHRGFGQPEWRADSRAGPSH
jgi:peptide/nickel transport system substrate-binding protein